MSRIGRKPIKIPSGVQVKIGDGVIEVEGKLSKLQPNWTYYSPDFERAVLKCLSEHWQLDYRSED